MAQGRGASIAITLAVVLAACGRREEPAATTPAASSGGEGVAATTPAPETASASSPAGGASVSAFQRALRERLAAAVQSRSTVVVGADGWLYFTAELRYLTHTTLGGEDGDSAQGATGASGATGSEGAREDGPLASVLDTHAQLAHAGIELLFVPVPAKAAIYPEHLGGAASAAPGEPSPDAALAAFLEQLRGHGVEVLDLGPLFSARKQEDPGDAGRLYCRQDTHWSGRGAALAASAIATKLRERPWLSAVLAASAQPRLEVEERPIEINGDLWRELPAPRPPREVLPLTFVGTRSATGLVPLPPSRESPVLLLGDSHVLVFHAGAELHASGAGLPDHLAHELGIAIDVVGVRGSGATPSRINLARRGAGALRGKRVVVWCLSARALTEARWQKVALPLPDPAAATGN